MTPIREESTEVKILLEETETKEINRWILKTFRTATDRQYHRDNRVAKTMEQPIFADLRLNSR
jgi:hypothetical protein